MACNSRMNTLKSLSRYEDKVGSSARLAYYFYSVCVAAAMAAALILISGGAAAQSADTAQPPAQASSGAAAADVAPRYSASQIERAFNFMDANKDGKISREEAAGFRSVARYFDAADVNKDNALSLEEFENALNRR